MSVIEKFTDPTTGEFVTMVDGVEQSRVAQPTQANAITLRTKAQAALTANDTFLATVATRRTNIATGKTTATSLSTATVTTVAQAQIAIRQIGTLLAQVATALDDLNNQAETVTKENSAVIRLILGQHDTTSGT